MALVLQESMRSLFYAPYYAALAKGAYEQEGLEVKLVSAPRPALAPHALFHGTADVTWGGPMRVNQLYDQRAHCDLVCIGEAVTRDPFLLVGRVPRPNFRLAVLAAVRIATVSEVPTPWLCLADDLRRIGIDPESIARIADWTMPENVDALRRGEIEAAQLCQPYAEELIAYGTGHLWYAAATRGECSYTTFYTRAEILEARRDEMLRLVRGLYRTQRWMFRERPDALADAIQPFFPAVARPLLIASLARYRTLGIWSRTPVLPRAGYERLTAALIAGGFTRGTPFEHAVDNSLAEQVVREDPRPLA